MVVRRFPASLLSCLAKLCRYFPAKLPCVVQQTDRSSIYAIR